MDKLLIYYETLGFQGDEVSLGGIV